MLLKAKMLVKAKRGPADTNASLQAKTGAADTNKWFIYVVVRPDSCQNKVDPMFVLDQSGSIVFGGYNTDTNFTKRTWRSFLTSDRTPRALRASRTGRRPGPTLTLTDPRRKTNFWRGSPDQITMAVAQTWPPHSAKPSRFLSGSHPAPVPRARVCSRSASS